MEPRPIFLLTDFGTEDPYVGLMKSVILEERPAAPIVDLTHEIPPQNEMNAAFLLEYAIRDLTEDAVVLLVVDPEVGTERDIIAVETEDGRIVVAPDTGLVDGLDWKRAFLVTNDDLSRAQVSSTFHGRDWFAPVGRFLSHGGALESVGSRVNRQNEGSPVPDPQLEDGLASGTIVHVDHFGNMISNVSRTVLDSLRGSDGSMDLIVSIGSERIDGLSQTYEEAEGLSALIGSFDRLEVSVPGGSASKFLGDGVGMSINVRNSEPSQEASA